VIELGDATILPGFIDLHVHVQSGMLRHGFTTLRNVGISLADLRRHPYVEPGLRASFSGPLISVKNGYPEVAWGPDIARDVTSPADARAAVRELVDSGAAWIKIALDSDRGGLPMLSVAEVRTIVDEAHAHGLKVTAHAEWNDGVQRAVAGGVDELAHIPCGADETQLRTLAARHVPIVATFHVIQNYYGGCQGVGSEFLALRGQLLYGTDVGNPRIPYGIDVEELRLMKSAGLKPEEVLAAATAAAGRELGDDQLGTLVEGAPADVIAVRGDARAFRTDMASPLIVISGGHLRVRRA
jgi:imidazolonepropionase-like amidohydrolase